ncbi:MAG: chemotaxis-specific protein-glutamate methyltransferase CheB [Oligoflexia bacterium]|nr:chemotaxis-specific protein-glutamate methyltransferase CheB [Oligoflexia bacterium]
MTRAEPNRIYVCAEPTVIQLETDAGGVVSACNPRSGKGGCFVLTESALPRLRTLLGELATQLQLLASCQPSDLELKVVGPGVIVDSVRKCAAELGLKLKGQHLDQGTVLAYFYSDSGRLRVQARAANLATPGEEPGRARKRRVLIVDDSAAVRKVLVHVFETDPEIEVVGTAESAHAVEKMIEQLRPDVITLDINMPEMDGITLLQRILPRKPLPVVMISSISMEEGDQVLRALELGAVDYIQKPSFSELDTAAPMICERVKMASHVKVGRRIAAAAVPTPRASSQELDSSVLVAIGASTGGTEALRYVLCRLPENIPPIVVVQHIPPVFSAAFAKRLNDLCPFEVKEAADGDLVQPNRVLVAPGGLQMRVKGRGKGPLRIQITDEAPVNRHKPSVDVLFDSVVDCVDPRKTIGVILTGMGGDGSRGMLKMRQAGSRTIAQDEASCVVFGMPKEAIRLGGVESVVSLDGIPDLLVRWLQRKNAA